MKVVNRMSKDTIYRQDAIDAIHEVMLGLFDFTDDNIEEPMTYTEVKFLHINKVIAEKIKALPAAETERKKGRWMDNNACPFCGFQPWYERDIHTLSFCPNCGADMRGKQDDQ